MSIIVRTASIADLKATRQVLVTTWHDTYDALIGRPAWRPALQPKTGSKYREAVYCNDRYTQAK